MNNLQKFTSPSFFLLLLLAGQLGLAQQTWINKNPFYERSFIENKGQFSRDIFWGSLNGDMHAFFSKDGFEVSEYYAEQKTSEGEAETEAAWKEDKLQFEFVNAEKSIPEPVNFCSHDLGFPSLKLSGIRSAHGIRYREIYAGTDLEFSFDQEHFGLKYLFEVRPGSDPGKIKFRVRGAQKIFIDHEGRLHVIHGKSELIDESPKANCAGKSVNIRFKLDKNMISFETGEYDRSKTLVIDPFLINPNFVADNKAFDIACDAAGNVFAYGGQNPWLLKKFDNAGNLQWTAVTTYSGYFGDLATDAAGNSVISEGCCNGGLQKISPANVSLWNQNYGVQEFWNLCFNCDYSNLYVAQGWATAPFLNRSVSFVNQSTGAVFGSSVVAPGSEPRAICFSPVGNIYMLTCNPGNSVVAVTASFSPLFSVSNNYTLVYNGPAYSNGQTPTAGQNAIAAGLNFFCTSDGQSLYKRNLLSGAIISSLAIPGGSTGFNSGLLIDNCDNIYVGSGDGNIYKYDANLNAIASASTGGAVYCLAPSVNGQVAACGLGFIGTFSMNFSGYTCNSSFSVSNGCSCTNSAGINVGSPFSNPTFSWNNGAVTPSLGNLCPGSYTCTVNSGCITETYTFLIAGGANLNSNANSSQDTLCLTDCSTLTASGMGGTPPYSYSWSPVNAAGSTVVVCPTVSVTYTCSISDANNCSSTSTIHITVKDCDTFIEEQKKNGNTFILYPNSNDGTFYVESKSIISRPVRFELFGLKGEKLYEQQILTGENKIIIRRQELAAGIYFWKIISGSGIIGKGKILIR